LKLFLAPHNDDEALYGSFTIMRERPLIVVVTDAARHAKRGLPIGVRRAESVAAATILQADVTFLDIPDDELTIDRAEDAFIRLKYVVETVYAPTWYGHGNADHNAVGQAARRVWGAKVVGYSTYTKQCPKVEGLHEIVPTESELLRKRKALACYTSQLQMNKIYFDHAWNGSEYLD